LLRGLGPSGLGSAEQLSARYEIPKAGGLVSWMKSIREERDKGNAEPGWVEATIGGRVFYYSEQAWTEGTIHPEGLALLKDAVDESLRHALQEPDRMTRAGHVPYAPYLTGE